MDDLIDWNSALWKEIKTLNDSFIINGKHYAIVTTSNAGGVVFYNKEMFGDSGVETPLELYQAGRNCKGNDTRYKKNSGRSQAQIKRREHEKSSVRAKVEHVFAVVKGQLKGQLRYRKTRYRGLRKQTAKLNMLFALANLILADRPSHLAA